MKKLLVECSSCGKSIEIPATQSGAENLIQRGWGGFGEVTYCPECSALWCAKNPDKPLPACRESILKL